MARCVLGCRVSGCLGECDALDPMRKEKMYFQGKVPSLNDQGTLFPFVRLNSEILKRDVWTLQGSLIEGSHALSAATKTFRGVGGADGRHRSRVHGKDAYSHLEVRGRNKWNRFLGTYYSHSYPTYN